MMMKEEEGDEPFSAANGTCSDEQAACARRKEIPTTTSKTEEAGETENEQLRYPLARKAGGIGEGGGGGDTDETPLPPALPPLPGKDNNQQQQSNHQLFLTSGSTEHNKWIDEVTRSGRADGAISFSSRYSTSTGYPQRAKFEEDVSASSTPPAPPPPPAAAPPAPPEESKNKLQQEQPEPKSSASQHHQPAPPQGDEGNLATAAATRLFALQQQQQEDAITNIRPGALAVAGMGHPSSSSSLQYEGYDNILQTTTPPRQPFPVESSPSIDSSCFSSPLAVASPVPLEEENTADGQQLLRNNFGGTLENAEMITDPETLQRYKKSQQQHKEKERTRWTNTLTGGAILLFLLVVVVSVAVVVVVSLLDLGSKKTTDPSFSQSSSLQSFTTGPSAWPSASPTLSLDLPNYTWETILREPTSPQARAHEWVSNDPNWSNYPSWKQRQRYALSTFYFAMNGDQWDYNHGWLNYSGDIKDECHWVQTPGFPGLPILVQEGLLVPIFENAYKGLYSNGRIQYDESLVQLPNNLNESNITCNARGEIIRLWFYSNNLRGTLPPQVSMLTALESLELAQQGGGTTWTEEIVGTIPSQLGLLTHLQFLLLEEISMTGTIPTQLGLLTSLVMGSLESPLFTGTIPTQLGLWSNVIFFSLSWTALSSTLPSQLGKLSNVHFMDFAGMSNLQGSLPTQLGLLQELRTVYFGSCSGLTGALPSQLGQNSKLMALVMDYSPNIGGQIPTEIGLLVDRLNFFHIFNTSLSGEIPTQLGQLSTELLSLQLQNNDLIGPVVPQELVRLSSLQRLRLSGNVGLNSTIPTELSRLENLSYLSLDHTSVSGTFPVVDAAVGGQGWISLKSLNVEDTFLTGTLSDRFCNLSESLQFDCVVDENPTKSGLCGCNCFCQV